MRSLLLPLFLVAQVAIAQPPRLVLPVGHTKVITKALFTPDGQYIVTASEDGTAKLWSANTGLLLQDIQGQGSGIYNIAISKSSDTLYTQGEGVTKMWWLKEGRYLKDTNMRWTYQPGPEKPVISPDGKKQLLIKNGCYLCPISCEVIDALTKEPLLTLEGHTFLPLFARFSPDGHSIFYMAYDSSIRVWNDEGASLLKDRLGNTTPQNGYAFSRDNKRLLIPVPEQQRINAWSLEKKAALKPILWGKQPVDQNEDITIEEVQWSADETRVSSAGRYPDDTGPSGTIWNALTGKLIRKYLMSDYTPSIYFSPDNKKIVLLNKAGIPLLLNAANGALIKQLQIGPTPAITQTGTGRMIADQQANLENAYLTAGAFSPDSKLMAAGATNGTVKIWSATTGALLQHTSNPEYTSSGTNGSINEIQFSNDSKRIATASWDGTAKLWDAATGRLLKTIKEHHSVVNSIRFSKDGTELLTAADTGSLILSSASNGEYIASLRKPYCNFIDPSFSPDGKKILATGLDNSLNIWNRQTHELLYSFFQVDSADYMYVLPSGYYKTTGAAARLLHYVTNNLDVMTFEQLDVKYNRPDKVLEATGCTDLRLIESYRKAYYKRLEKLGIDSSSFGEGYSFPVTDLVNRHSIEPASTQRELLLHIRASDSVYLLDRFNIWINEVPLFGLKGIGIRGQQLHRLDTIITVQLEDGINLIETSVTNTNGIESFRQPFQVNYAPQQVMPGKTYFIGIGINHFADSTNNLKWCVQDIHDLATTLKNRYGSSLVILDTLYNERATLANIKALKQQLLQTGINDRVIISYSGHGLFSKDYDYYLSAYQTDFSSPEKGSIAYGDMENLLDSIPARKKLLLLDACNSGEIDKEEMKKIQLAAPQLATTHTSTNVASRGGIVTFTGDNSGKVGLQNSFELMQSLFVDVGKGTGAMVIAAAGGVQFAQERSELGHGVFTFSVIETLQQHPAIKISALKKLIDQRVLELSRGFQQPTTRSQPVAVDWEL